jgi:hypothetical protein
LCMAFLRFSVISVIAWAVDMHEYAREYIHENAINKLRFVLFFHDVSMQ